MVTLGCSVADEDPAVASDLAGSSWEVFGAVQSSFAIVVESEGAATLAFGDSDVSVDTSCALGRGEYTEAGSAVELGSVDVAEPQCGGDPLAAMIDDHMRQVLEAGVLEVVEDHERPDELLLRRGAHGLFLRRR